MRVAQAQQGVAPGPHPIPLCTVEDGQILQGFGTKSFQDFGAGRGGGAAAFRRSAGLPR